MLQLINTLSAKVVPMPEDIYHLSNASFHDNMKNRVS